MASEMTVTLSFVKSFSTGAVSGLRSAENLTSALKLSGFVDISEVHVQVTALGVLCYFALLFI